MWPVHQITWSEDMSKVNQDLFFCSLFFNVINQLVLFPEELSCIVNHLGAAMPGRLIEGHSSFVQWSFFTLLYLLLKDYLVFKQNQILL